MKKSTLLTASLLAGSAFLFTAYGQEYLEGYIIRSDLEEAVDARYQDATHQMSYTYDTLAQVLDSTGRTKLENAQKAWKTYSKAECVFDTDYVREEPYEKLLYVDCLNSMTEERIAYLDYQLQYYTDPSLAQTGVKN